MSVSVGGGSSITKLLWWLTICFLVYFLHSYRSVLLLLQLMTQTGMWNMTAQLNINPFKAAGDRLNVGFNRPRSSQTRPRNQETSKKQYTCQVCNAVFRTWGGRYYHMAKHTGKYRFCCDLCDRGFMRSDEYRNHMKTHRRVIQASLKKWIFNPIGAQSTFFAGTSILLL